MTWTAFTLTIILSVRRDKFSRDKIDFPDGAAWKTSGVNSGLSRDDWRRHNVDIFMEQVYRAIKAEKPWVKFGISPFGIWRPKNPPGIKGFDAYAEIYADSRKWLREGWCDYLAPQLYWGIAPPQTSFATLFDWWNSENVRHRHIWPGINSLKVGAGWEPVEIVNEIKAMRRFPDDGQIHWNSSALMKNGALDAALLHDCYQQPALIPASPWLDAIPPARPELHVNPWKNTLTIGWENGGAEPARWWVLQCRTNNVWTTEIFPANESGRFRENFSPDAIAVRAVDPHRQFERAGGLVSKKIATGQRRRQKNKSQGEFRRCPFFVSGFRTNSLSDLFFTGLFPNAPWMVTRLF